MPVTKIGPQAEFLRFNRTKFGGSGSGSVTHVTGRFLTFEGCEFGGNLVLGGLPDEGDKAKLVSMAELLARIGAPATITPERALQAIADIEHAPPAQKPDRISRWRQILGDCANGATVLDSLFR